MHGGDKQGQLSVAVELPELVWVLMRYHWSSLLWVGTKCTSTCSQVTLLCAFCADPHGNLQGRDGQGPHNLGEQKHEGPLIGLPLPLQRKRMCQRHPLRRGHLGEVVSGAQNGQAPTVGLAPAARRWSGSQNASCFFGRSLRNVHFGNARLTPQIHTFPLRAAHHHFSHRPVGPAGDTHMLTHGLHILHIHYIHSQAERQKDRQPWHDLA